MQPKKKKTKTKTKTKQTNQKKKKKKTLEKGVPSLMYTSWHTVAGGKLFSENLHYINHKSTHTVSWQTDSREMKISALIISLILSLSLCEVNSALSLKFSGDGLKQRAWLTEDTIGAGVSTEVSTVKCKLQGSTRLPAFSLDGDFVIGGVFSIHSFTQTVRHNYTTMPEPQKCTGRLVRGICDVYRAVTLCGDKCEDLYDALTIMLQRHCLVLKNRSHMKCHICQIELQVQVWTFTFFELFTEKCIQWTGKPNN